MSKTYEHAIQLTAWPLSPLLLYLSGVKSLPIIVLCWMPAAMILMGLWMYIGIYFVPPRLELNSQERPSEPPSVLGLGSR